MNSVENTKIRDFFRDPHSGGLAIWMMTLSSLTKASVIWLLVFCHHVIQLTMDCVVIVMTNQVERTKGLSLNNNEQQRRCQVYLKTFWMGYIEWAHQRLRIQIRLGFLTMLKYRKVMWCVAGPLHDQESCETLPSVSNQIKQICIDVVVTVPHHGK